MNLSVFFYFSTEVFQFFSRTLQIISRSGTRKLYCIILYNSAIFCYIAVRLRVSLDSWLPRLRKTFLTIIISIAIIIIITVM